MGPSQRLVLTPKPDNTYDTVVGDLGWMGGEALRISARGAPSGFPAFRHDFHVPTDATLTPPLFPNVGATINRSLSLDFTWDPVQSPNQAKSTFTVTVGTGDGSKNVQCDYPLTKHERGQVPATILSALPATLEAFVSFDVRQERAEFLNRARDFVLTAVITQAVKPSGSWSSS
jgi:hypothetical protein